MSVRSRPAGGIRGIISTSHRDGTMLSLAVAMEVSSVTTWAQLDQGWVPLAGVAVAIVVLLGARAGRSGEFLELVLPIGAMLLLAASREVRLTVPGMLRLRRLLRLTAMICVAATVPIALLVLRYVSAGAGHALLAGAVHEGFARVPLLQSALPTVWTILAYSLPVYVLLALEYRAGQRWWAPVIGGLAAVGMVAFAFVSRNAYLALWYFGMSLLPAAIVFAAVTGRRAWRRQIPLDPIVLAIAAMTALFSLNQFPYSAPNYFAYVAPLAILTAALVAAHYHALPKLVFGGMALAAFAGIVLRVGSVHTVGLAATWWDDNHRLAVARGGLRVPASDSAQYTNILQLVTEHRGTGTMYAGPELPEMYFLSGARSPLREVFRFLPSGTADSTQMERSFNVSVAKIVLINHAPIFLGPIPPSVLAWLAIRYPQSERIGTIEARWR